MEERRRGEDEYRAEHERCTDEERMPQEERARSTRPGAHPCSGDEVNDAAEAGETEACREERTRQHVAAVPVSVEHSADGLHDGSFLATALNLPETQTVP